MHGPSTFQLILYALLIVAVGYAVGGWLTGVLRMALERARVDPAVREPLVRMLRPLVLLLALLEGLHVFGVNLNSVVALLGAAALAIALALRDTLANVAAGAVLLTLRPFRGGDLISGGGAIGVVLELGLFTTTLKTSRGVHTVVPNSLFLKGPIENHSRNGLLAVEVRVRVAPDADVPMVQQTLSAALDAVPQAKDDPAPVVRLLDVDPAGVDLLVQVWFANEHAEAGRAAVVLAARDALKRAKILLISTANLDL